MNFRSIRSDIVPKHAVSRRQIDLGIHVYTDQMMIFAGSSDPQYLFVFRI